MIMMLNIVFLVGPLSAQEVTANNLNIVYVSTNGNDTNDGSQPHPFQSLSKAISSVNGNGTICVGRGTYSGPKNRNLTINKNVKITSNGSDEFITIDAENQDSILNINSNITVKIENIIFKNAVGDYGAAIYNLGNLSINRSCLASNSANYGGAVYNGGVLDITHTNIESNTATFAGSILNKGSINVSYTNFNYNSAIREGGAIVNLGEMDIRDNCCFSNNKAPGNGDQNGGGGAIGNEGDLTFTNTTFYSNEAVFGGAILNRNNGTILMNSSYFSFNNADFGGAIDNTNECTINNTYFVYNSADEYGGGLYNTVDGFYNMTNSIIRENKAIDLNLKYGKGGGVYNKGYCILTNNKITNNIATQSGGAIENNNGYLENVGTNIFSKNNPDNIHNT